MGSMLRLKKKDELHYRKGSTNESQNCRYCKNFIAESERCFIFGAVQESIRYRVRPDFTCDAQHLDESKCSWLKERHANHG